MIAVPCWVSAQVNVPMSQYDHNRTGANLQEFILNPSNVTPDKFGKLFSRKVDADITALPLVISNLEIAGKKRNVVFVATARNTLYAFDADDPFLSRPLWRKNLGTPVGGIGILGTPYIDVTSGTLYAVAMVGGRVEANFRVNAIDISDGSHKYNSPQSMSFPFADSEGTITHVPYALQRSGLLVDNDALYIAFANIVPDAADPQLTQEGFVQAFNARDLTQRLGVFQVTPTGQKGGIWQAGRGIAADGLGNIYFSTAGGSYDGISNFGSSTLKLAGPDLEPVDWFAPSNHELLFHRNIDISAGGVTLIPDSELLFSGGKEGVIYLLNRNDMGKLETVDSAPLQRFKATDGCGTRDCSQTLGTAYWGRQASGTLYVWDKADVLRAYEFIDSRFEIEPSALSAAEAGMTGGPSVSANGTDEQSGIVWAVTTASTNNFGQASSGTLRAFPADDISQEIYNSDMVGKRDSLGDFTKFAPPVVANGKVYATSNALTVFGTLCGHDISSTVDIEFSDLKLERRNRYTQTITVTNLSSHAIGSPFDIALDKLSPGVRITNSKGKTSCAEPEDSPLIRVNDAPLWLAANQSISVTLRFRSRTDEINFDARVLSGSSPR